MAVRWEQSYDWRPGGRLTIDQKQGHTTILGWDQPRSEIVAEFPNAEAGTPIDDLLEVEHRSGGLQIEVIMPRRWFGWSHCPCELTVRVPYATKVDLESGQGNVTVEWVQGPVGVETGQGNVTLRGVGDAEIETGQGNVFVAQHQGSLNVETGMGKVELEQVRGTAIDIETGMGEVRVDGVEARSLKVEGGAGTLQLRRIATEQLSVESGMGRVEVELVSLHPRGEYTMETGAGALDLLLPPLSDADLRLETGLGRVRLDLPGVQREGSRGGETQLRLGSGGAKVRVESGMGAVFVGTTNAPAPSPIGGAQPIPPTPVRQEELERILNLVAEGKVSPAEAEALIAALENK